ncbi:hypothetical protein J5U23_00457 [Saccharolobus shibatae B12]|uniref:Uncharacterized protein n=1 Tax=Saccharolobus shibatae (strain ATCC 51178 / DSM 5389 / JCM 8931 / NBRC 15437 / B12) TaxID=523848 RepID=A0A8F5BLN5_SACSH|nr:hypothetical protein J5U23_00457 [Saccharolobus shibatae B12]
MWKKFQLSLRQGKYKAAKLLYQYINCKVRRRFKGEFTKKRNRSYFASRSSI